MIKKISNSDYREIHLSVGWISRFNYIIFYRTSIVEPDKLTYKQNLSNYDNFYCYNL